MSSRPTTFPPAMRRLVNELTKLPSIGEKSAIRIAYQLLTGDERRGQDLAGAIRDALERTRLCKICFSLTESEVCAICGDLGRDQQVICVVEKPADVLAIERSGSYHGLYHVLHGLWSPLRGVGFEQTRIGELFRRVRGGDLGREQCFPSVQELLLATGTTVEGDATALYIAHSVPDFGIRVTRIAQGLPKGGELEYADDVTLNHAIVGRRSLA